VFGKMLNSTNSADYVELYFSKQKKKGLYALEIKAAARITTI